jgi:hypothetical protein
VAKGLGGPDDNKVSVGLTLVYRSHYSSMNSRILLHAVVMLASLYVMVSIPAATTADSRQAQQDKLRVYTPSFRAAAEDRHQLPA